jgi:hypothetical protein
MRLSAGAVCLDLLEILAVDPPRLRWLGPLVKGPSACQCEDLLLLQAELACLDGFMFLKMRPVLRGSKKQGALLGSVSDWGGIGSCPLGVREVPSSAQCFV